MRHMGRNFLRKHGIIGIYTGGTAYAYFSGKKTQVLRRRVMKQYVVVRVVDADTIEVQPEFTVDNTKHSIIGFKGYYGPDISEPGYFKAREHLAEIVLHKEIRLSNPEVINYNRINCDITMGGKNLVQEIITAR